MSECLYTFRLITSRVFSLSPTALLRVTATGAALALTLLCFLSGLDAVSFLPFVVGAAALLVALTVGCLTMGSRPLAVFGLVYSVPFSLMHHFVYRPNIGAADGLTVELIDVWIVCLLIHYVAQCLKENVTPVHGLAAFCVPLTLLLVADLFSFTHSADIDMSIYGILNHLRASILFIVLALALAQGKRELRAASLAIVCAVVTIGGVCIGEMILKTNIRANVFVDGMGDSIFRAAGLFAPNGTAAYLAALLPLVAIEYFFPFSRQRKRLAGVGLCMGLAGMGCTLSRASFVILAVGSMPLVIFLFRRRLIRGMHIMLCFVALAVLLASLGEKISARLGEGTDDLNGRVALMATALKMASNSPLFGEGINNYELKMRHFIPADQTQKFQFVVHNKFLLTLAETGLLGLAAFVWLVGIASHRAYLLARRKLPLGIALLCSVVIVTLDMNVESYDSGTHLLNAWILIAVIAALWSAQASMTQRVVRRPSLTYGHEPVARYEPDGQGYPRTAGLRVP